VTLGAKQTGRNAIRDLIATENPARADDLADFVMIAMAGMSAAARDGADAATLMAFVETTSRAFRRELTSMACSSPNG
jgi:TetR/AcrR family transcriptional repressor for divergent bdcA